MYDVVFVVLNYIAYEETINCINSILKIPKDKKYHILIVENDSPNESYYILKNKFDFYDNITILKSNENKMFTGGMNFGYNYAKENFNSKFIICANNDIILINSKKFIDYIENEYEISKFHLLGPDVISLSTKLHQNPHMKKNFNSKNIKKYIFLTKIERTFIPLALFLEYLGIYQVLKSFLLNRKKTDYKNRLENIVLHGSFIIYSEKYINYMEYAFYPEINFFLEENALSLICKNKNFKVVYNPKLKVLHKHSATRNKVMSNNFKKKKYFLDEHLKSFKVIESLLNL